MRSLDLTWEDKMCEPNRWLQVQLLEVFSLNHLSSVF
jgi:hypothetical protein